MPKGLKTDDGKDHFEGEPAQGIPSRASQEEVAASEAVTEAIAKDVMDTYIAGVADPDKPFVGAQPKLLKHPEIADKAQTARATKVAIKNLNLRIAGSTGVLLILAEDSQYSPLTQKLLKDAHDDEASVKGASVTVQMATDFLQTLPRTEKPIVSELGDRLLIYVGTPGKYMAMCIRAISGLFDKAYAVDKLVVLCKSACMLPLGTQEENIFGVHSEEVFDAIADAVRKKGSVAWGHGVGTKASYLQKAFGYASPMPMPKPVEFTGEAKVSWDYLADYIKYTNQIKLAQPELRVTNYYDTGLLVSVMMGYIVEKGTSLLLDRDGLAILRDASIGHIISKLNQVVAVKPFCEERAVYNFFIGDGACRLNGGAELALHLLEGYKTESLITLFILNNHKWAIEDNLVAETEKEHALHNRDFYELIAQHDQACLCETEHELRMTINHLGQRTHKYLEGKAKPGLNIVIVRGLDMTMPPILGDISPIVKSPEMAFMREVLGAFSADCKSPVPLYGCSAFEYIQYLHIFLEQMPEGKKYQYVCGRTDIQAAHMCGFTQPDGKCVLFINDVYGVNSLGESLRFVLSGFGGKQLLIFIWHPSLITVMDHFHLHRPPLVWPSLGPELAKYYVRSESDALFLDFEGNLKSSVTSDAIAAIQKKVPVVLINIMPEQECNYISLDVRLKKAEQHLDTAELTRTFLHAHNTH
eukprot:CAMPEP_0171103364 /NCGR_PEP_ID=MMETSP0766_2-20121228/58877_1 /TAXON_ID=439317 /ORGANISM="Gambierdiscus australes, Strain CAWD 149" /LENGTH=698 /DNA_ID=CAMNT_0011563783 /DNA_START=8 /DNA_END=2102 /DNA_ORIENTATION=+